MKDSEVVQAEEAAQRDLALPDTAEELASSRPAISSIPPAPVAPARRWVGWAPYGAVVLLGALLRFIDLGARPLHFDESEHAYFSLILQNNLQHWPWCVGLGGPPVGYGCFQYNPLIHGPFQFHAIALVYQVSQWLGAPDNGVNTTTVRLAAALLGSILVILPYFLRDYLSKFGSWLACLLLAISPSMVYFSRFAREDIYMACFTLLLVVAVARYIRERKMRWLLVAAAGFALSYATSEATFLTIAVFGSFLGALLVWEIGTKFRLRERLASAPIQRFLPRTYAPVTVLAYFLVVGVAAKLFFAELDQLSTFINNHQATSDVALIHLEAFTVALVPWLGIVLGLYVFSILAREMYGKVPPPGRRGLARFVDRRQPLLDTILTVPWTHWFFALLLGWSIFLLLFTIVFTNVAGGIGDGIWKGLYYWLTQQKVARGDEPWYYYLLLIPLYEQIGVVFGLVGIVRVLLKPNPFRLFLTYWFLGDLFLYSWAGEKMPWLMIFMTMPMLLLAALGLEPCVMACYHFARERFFASATPSALSTHSQLDRTGTTWPRQRVGVRRAALGLFGVVMAVLLLLPTLQNMYEVNYVHSADGPHEMMVYVQTPNDVNSVMERIALVDRQNFGGKHQVQIGVTADAIYPFIWYLRDYPNVCAPFPTNCPNWQNTAPVIIGSSGLPAQDIGMDDPQGLYLHHVYQLRTWWDQGYKPQACPRGHYSPGICSDPNQGSGVGPLLWLSYGDNPPPGAKFNLGLTIQHIWNWWWYRQPFGSTDGAYDMVLFIRKTMNVQP